MLRISQASLDALAASALDQALARAVEYLRVPPEAGRAQSAIALARPRARDMRLEEQGHIDALLALVLDLGPGAEGFLAHPDNAALIREPGLAGHQKLFALIERARQTAPPYP